jgi:hypothetical protein
LPPETARLQRGGLAFGLPRFLLQRLSPVPKRLKERATLPQDAPVDVDLTITIMIMITIMVTVAVTISVPISVAVAVTIVAIPIPLIVPLTFANVPPSAVLVPAALALIIQLTAPAIGLFTAFPVLANRLIEFGL